MGTSGGPDWTAGIDEQGAALRGHQEDRVAFANFVGSHFKNSRLNLWLGRQEGESQGCGEQRNYSDGGEEHAAAGKSQGWRPVSRTADEAFN